MSFAWDSTANVAGFAGHAFSTSLAPGQGQHGSMSPHETRNVLFVSGPAFRESATVAPPPATSTSLPRSSTCSACPAQTQCTGRILEEALRHGPETVPWHTTTHKAETHTPAGAFRQEISISRVNTTLYVNHGTARIHHC